MAKSPKISDAEWEVMQVVWEEAPILACDIVERLAPRTGWSDRTIRTMLGRLVSKRALTYKEQGNRYLYRPRISREACLAEASQSFLSRVFCGESGSLLAHFVENSELTQDDLAQLRDLLDEKAKDGERSS